MIHRDHRGLDHHFLGSMTKVRQKMAFFCSFQACEECKTHGDWVFLGLAGFLGALGIMGLNLDRNTKMVPVDEGFLR